MGKRRADDFLRSAKQGAVNACDSEMVNAIDAALLRGEQDDRRQKNRHNASRPRHSRVGNNLVDELDALVKSMSRPDAVKELARRYNVTPARINQKLREES